MIKLYSYYRSPASYRVRIALNCKGIEYKYESIHLVRKGGEQNAPEYKKLNPQAMVPTLVDGAVTLTQSIAIMEYLEEKYPDPHILPKKAAERAYVRQISQIIASDIHPLTTLRVSNHLSGEMGVSQAKKTEWLRKWIKQGLDAVEKLLEKSEFRDGPYCCGDHVTMADMCLIPQLNDAHRHDVSVSSWPLISEIEKNCLMLKTFQDASPESQPDTPEDQRLSVLKAR